MHAMDNDRFMVTPGHYRDFLERSGAGMPDAIPRFFIACFNNRLHARLRDRHQARPLAPCTGDRAFVIGHYDLGVGLVGGFGIGAPAAVVQVEELAMMGATRFVLLGTAGAIDVGLNIGDIVICSTAWSDEGTSRHYDGKEGFVAGSEILRDVVGAAFTQNEINTHIVSSWTTDAPYRERLSTCRRLRSLGVSTVEMEASAVFSLAAHRHLETAAVFVISDRFDVEGRWTPGFDNPSVMTALEKAGDILADLLVSPLILP